MNKQIGLDPVPNDSSPKVEINLKSIRFSKNFQPNHSKKQQKLLF
jgi:hypothetical protein